MKNQPTVTVRLSAEDRRQLDALMQAWGESQSDAIRRAIQMAYGVVWNQQNPITQEWAEAYNKNFEGRTIQEIIDAHKNK
jgi:hypothetical protein